MIDAAPVAAASTFVLIRVLAKFAPALGLLDVPDERKRHEGTVPMVGGIAIGLAYLATSTLLLPEILVRPVLDAGIALLLCIGALDERMALRPRSRLITQVVVALGLVVVGGLHLTSFGDLVGFGEVTLSSAAGALFTVFFVVSLINGFNMLDGLDGLAGGVGAIMLTALCLGAASVGAVMPLAHMVTFLAALLSFLVIYNIQSPLRRRLVFLGDAGSMVLGFVLAWGAIKFAQHPQGSIYPISVVWIFGLVVLDTVATVIRRVSQRRSPLSPGRDHLHHLLQELGLSPRRAVWVMYIAAGVMAAVGLAGWTFGIREYWLTISFVAVSLVYYAALATAWRRIARRCRTSAVNIAQLSAATGASNDRQRRSRRAA